jgi:hypothetical protein
MSHFCGLADPILLLDVFTLPCFIYLLESMISTYIEITNITATSNK